MRQFLKDKMTLFLMMVMVLFITFSIAVVLVSIVNRPQYCHGDLAGVTHCHEKPLTHIH
jgi:hypothetical protein